MARIESFSYAGGTFLDKVLSRWRARVVSPYIQPHVVVCDFGCGKEASFLKSILPLIKKGIGIDFAGEIIRHEKLEFRQGDLNQSIPVEQESVEVVTALAVIEHLENPQNVISEAYRILKKNGTLILTTPAPCARLVLDALCFLHLINASEIHDHKQYFSIKSLEQIMSCSGFSQWKITRFQFGFNLLLIAKK